MKNPQWIARRTILLLHLETLAEHGGLPGIRDPNALDAALARPQHQHTYDPKSDAASLAAAYSFGLVRGHPFSDGNKRVGLLAAGLFLALNGMELNAEPADVVQIVESLAAGKISEIELAAWIRQHAMRAS